MKIIQTFWSKPFLYNGNYQGSWLSDESNFMCWALSCLNAKKFYGEIELFTDKAGKALLIDKFGLPYDKVHIVLDNDFLDSIPVELWALSKIYTYSLQTEPFIHIDGDFIFWNKIDIEKELICQNLEIGVENYREAYEQLAAFKSSLTNSVFNKCIDEEFNNIAVNAGIIGGLHCKFIKQYSDDILRFIKDNVQFLSKFMENALSFNCFVEQYYFYYKCNKNNIKFSTIHPDYWQSTKKDFYCNIPIENNSFNHYLGQNKKKAMVNDFVKSRLFKYYPQFYRNIKKYCITCNTFDISYFNVDNNDVNINTIFNNFNKPLLEKGIIFDEELIKNYFEFLYYKKNLVKRHTISRCTNDIMHNNLKLFDEHSGFEARLTPNFIAINKYLAPWEELMYVQKFNKISKEANVSKNHFPKAPYWCMFSYTPFESSVNAVTLSNIYAYIIGKILLKEFQPISTIVRQVRHILKEKENASDEQIKIVLIKILKDINIYEIIEIKHIGSDDIAVNNAKCPN